MNRTSSYHVDHHQLLDKKDIIKTDPNLYVLKNKFNSLPSPTEHHLASSHRLAYVEALVDINAVVIESIWYQNTNNKCSKSSVVPLRTFIQEVLKRSRTTYSTLQTALFYLFRARPLLLQQQARRNAYINCGRRMFLASLVIASKFVQDKTYRNSAWAKIAGLSVQEINSSERHFVSVLDYRLYIDQTVFDKWHQLLHLRTQARMHHIPTRIQDLLNIAFHPTHIIDSSKSHNVLLSYPTTKPCISSDYYYYSPSPTPALSLPSSIHSSPLHTPLLANNAGLKRKLETVEDVNKKHCRFWQ